MSATDFRFTFQLQCRACKAKMALKMAAYPHQVGTDLPSSYGIEASCLRCGVAKMEILNSPEQPITVIEPRGFLTDPRK